MLENIYDFAKDNWTVIFALLIFFGGGSALSFKVPGLIDIIKNILSTPEELRTKRLDNDYKALQIEAQELEIQNKRLELQRKLMDSGISPETLVEPLRAVTESTSSLQAEPIILGEPFTISEDNENEESSDIEEE